ncbi:MAG TPA: alanine racemase [Pyrinomonadaceae bacterium]|nr:alanine racemase [Pyrinomonadaceae bacterium]
MMIETEPLRPTQAVIDLDNLAFNLHSSRNFIGGEIGCMAVVKADAYGHGAVACARRLEAEGVNWFAVALAEEGIELREAGIKLPILCLGGCLPGQAETFFAYDLTPVVFNLEAAASISNAALNAGRTARVHIKIDTGMGRIGVSHSDAAAFADRMARLPNLYVEGLMTHFASADDLAQADFTALQTSRFYDAIEAFAEKGLRPDIVDLANSPGAIAHAGSRGNMVRLGGILYGLGEDVLPAQTEKPELRPVMSVKTRVVQINPIMAGETVGYGRTHTLGRDSLIGALPIGYSDGYRRTLSNKARVIVNGSYAPVVGRISMDWTLIDLTDSSGTKLGDEVVLLGSQADLDVTAGELARLADTISYEITCGISSRVRREFSTGRA